MLPFLMALLKILFNPYDDVQAFLWHASATFPLAVVLYRKHSVAPGDIAAAEKLGLVAFYLNIPSHPGIFGGALLIVG